MGWKMTTALFKIGIKVNQREIPDMTYNGKLIEFIDYTQTTAYECFCGIRFKDENEIYWIQNYRLEVVK